MLPLPLATWLAGCGFHPIYAPGSAGELNPVQSELAAISVGVIGERSGQLLRQALQARFERGGLGVARRYDLAVRYAQTGEGISVQPDASVTRIRVTATAAWTLLSKGLQPVTLDSGQAHAIDGFDIINEQYFAVDMNTDSLTRRLAEAIADQMTLQVATYFTRHPATG